MAHQRLRLILICIAIPALAVAFSNAVPRDANNWWWQSAFGPTGLRILALLVTSCAALFFTLWLAARLAARNRLALARQSGTAIIEFALLFPVALLLFLVILQTAFLYTANFYVNLAAYRAARAAIVWAEFDPAPPDLEHTLVIGPEARRRIENAAIFSCVGISGTSSDGTSTGTAAAQDETWQHFIGRPMGWRGQRFQNRYDYARAHTRVEVTTQRRPDSNLSPWNYENQDFYRFREPIAVQVEHDFELAVPFAKWVLGDKDNQGTSRNYRYIQLRASYTLVNEGRPELSAAAPPGPPPP